MKKRPKNSTGASALQITLSTALICFSAVLTADTFAGTDSSSGAIQKKLDPQIVLALKQSRGEPPFDKPTSLQPDIPIKDAGRVLVEMDATVSKELLEQVALIGGQVWSSAESSHTICAMVPLSQLETLAARADVKSISPARLYDTSKAK